MLRMKGKDEKHNPFIRSILTVHQKQMDIVRASDSPIAKRHLLISGYLTDVTLTCDPLSKLPMILPVAMHAPSVHDTPAGFCILIQEESWSKVALANASCVMPKIQDTKNTAVSLRLHSVILLFFFVILIPPLLPYSMVSIALSTIRHKGFVHDQ